MTSAFDKAVGFRKDSSCPACERKFGDAVSPIWNRLPILQTRGSSKFMRLAECNSAIQQSAAQPQPNRNPAKPQRRDDRRACIRRFLFILRVSAVDTAFGESWRLGTISRDTDRLQICATTPKPFTSMAARLRSLPLGI